jgi:hypothetical protein
VARAYPRLAQRNSRVHRLKQEGKIAEAIKAMNTEILKDFVSDETSWEELAELCVSFFFPRVRKHHFHACVQLRYVGPVQARCFLHGGGVHVQAILPHALHQAGRVSDPAPRPSPLHRRLAPWPSHSFSLCFSAGDLEAARSYYSMSLQLKPKSNLRAAWGLALATSQLAAAPAVKEADADVEALNGIAVTALCQEYDASKNSRLSEVVRGWAGR